MTMNDDAVRRLMLAELHGHEGAQSPIEIEHMDDRIVLTCGHYELVIMNDRAHHPISFSGVSVQTLDHLDKCLALLQRAKQIMGGGA